MPDGFRGFCPDCTARRWHDGEIDGEADCRACGTRSTSTERRLASVDAGVMDGHRVDAREQRAEAARSDDAQLRLDEVTHGAS